MSRSHSFHCLALALASGLAVLPVQAADWPRFRGPNGTGVSGARGLPTEFGPDKNVAWKVKVPTGHSSPVVSAGRVFLTAPEGDERVVLCLDEKNGEALWRRAVKKVRAEVFNPMSGPATPTPAADGERVFAFFPDAGLIAIDGTGSVTWSVDPGPFKSMHGIAASPVIAGGRVVLQIDQLEGSWLAAFDGRTGKRLWRVERPSGVTGGYSTPSLHQALNQALQQDGAGPPQVIVSSPLELAGHDLSTGKKLWWVTGVTNAPVGLPVVHGDTVYLCEPVGEPVDKTEDSLKPFLQMDRNKDGKVSADELTEPYMALLLERIDRGFGNGDGAVELSELKQAFGTFVGRGGLAAVRLGGSGDTTATAIRWRYTKAVPFIPSVLVHGGALFIIRDGGILTSLDPESGEVVLQGRLQEAMGKYYASPVAADGKAFFTSEEGKVTVVEAKPEWKVLATNDLDATCLATPALAEGRIYVRAGDTLYAFGQAR